MVNGIDCIDDIMWQVVQNIRREDGGEILDTR